MASEPSSNLGSEAVAIGVRLMPGSHWPVGWHAIVVEALKTARQLGVTQLYIKEKFGLLRLQGGGARFMPALPAIEHRVDRSCACCGKRCRKPTVPNLPLCPDCGDRAPSWVEIQPA
jgi:hypothetical protein